DGRRRHSRRRLRDHRPPRAGRQRRDGRSERERRGDAEALLQRRRSRTPAAGELDDESHLRVVARRRGAGSGRWIDAEVLMDLVLKLREVRRLRGLSQKDVARLSGVGEKTISSFETGERIGSLKLAQLRRMLTVYGLTEAEFFGGTLEKQIAPWELNEEEFATTRLVEDLHHLPKPVQKEIGRASCRERV